MIHELPPDMKKRIKILWAHKLVTKAQRMQMKMQKQQSTAHNSKNDTWTIAEIETKHQNTVGTQANDESTKNANQSAKATKVLRTTAKMIHELPPDMKKHIKILWAHKLVTKAQRMQIKSAKATKVLRTTAKMIHELLPKLKQNIKILWAHTSYESTKNANQSAKATKVLRTTAKMIHELLPKLKQNIKILWAHKLTTKAQRMQIKVQKQRKYCAQQQKWYMNYCRIWNKTSKYCGHAEWYDFSPSDTTT